MSIKLQNSAFLGQEFVQVEAKHQIIDDRESNLYCHKDTVLPGQHSSCMIKYSNSELEKKTKIGCKNNYSLA